MSLSNFRAHTCLSSAHTLEDAFLVCLVVRHRVPGERAAQSNSKSAISSVSAPAAVKSTSGCGRLKQKWFYLTWQTADLDISSMFQLAAD